MAQGIGHPGAGEDDQHQPGPKPGHAENLQAA